MNEDEFEALYLELKPLVYRAIKKWLYVDDSIVEDLTADTFLKVWATREAYQEQGFVKAWVMRIAHNFAVSYTRSGAFKHNVAIPEYFDVPDTEDNPEEACVLSSQIQEMQQAMTTLPAEHNQLLDLRFNQGLDWRSVGEHCGMTDGMARVVSHRALAKLRRRMEAVNV